MQERVFKIEDVLNKIGLTYLLNGKVGTKRIVARLIIRVMS